VLTQLTLKFGDPIWHPSDEEASVVVNQLELIKQLPALHTIKLIDHWQKVCSECEECNESKSLQALIKHPRLQYCYATSSKRSCHHNADVDMVVHIKQQRHAQNLVPWQIFEYKL